MIRLRCSLLRTMFCVLMVVFPGFSIFGWSMIWRRDKRAAGSEADEQFGHALLITEEMHIAIAMVDLPRSRWAAVRDSARNIVARRTGPVKFHYFVDQLTYPLALQWLATEVFQSCENRAPTDEGDFAFPLVNFTVMPVRRSLLSPSWLPGEVHNSPLELLKLSKLVTIPALLHEGGVDRVLILDCCDTAILGDLRDLWLQFAQFVPGHTVVALAPELTDTYATRTARYSEHLELAPATDERRWGFNSGVVLLDVRQAHRSQFVRSAVLGAARSWARLSNSSGAPMKYSDQDVLNLFAKSHPTMVHQLPCAWNVAAAWSTRRRACASAILLHHGDVHSMNEHGELVRKIISQVEYGQLLRMPFHDERTEFRLLASSAADFSEQWDHGTAARPTSHRNRNWTWFYGYFDMHSDNRSDFLPFSTLGWGYDAGPVDEAARASAIDQLARAARSAGHLFYDLLLCHSDRAAHNDWGPCTGLRPECCRLTVNTSTTGDRLFQSVRVGGRPWVVFRDFIGVGRHGHYSNEHWASTRRLVYEGIQPSPVHVFIDWMLFLRSSTQQSGASLPLCEDKIAIVVDYVESGGEHRRRLVRRLVHDGDWVAQPPVVYFAVDMQRGDFIDFSVESSPEVASHVRIPLNVNINVYEVL